MTDRGFRWLVILCASAASVLTPTVAYLSGPGGPGAWQPDRMDLTLLGLGSGAAIALLLVWVRNGGSPL